METEIKLQAEKLFKLAQKANLVTTEDFSSVFPKVKLGEISDGINRDKNIFIQNNPEVKDSEKLWNEGVDLRTSEAVAQMLLDFLIEINKSFSVSYDQPVEDVIFNFKSVTSDLSISELGEKQEDGEWFQGMKVGDETFWYQSEAPGLVGEVLFDLGRKLFPRSKGIVQANFGDQNQYLILDLDLVPEFADFGFTSI